MTAPQKVAVITGASQGIDAALVRAYRGIGYLVVANSRSIRQPSDDGVLAVAGDIGDRTVAQRVMAEGMERFRRIDTLVNNAGIFIAKPFTLYTLEEFELLSRTHLSGFFNASQFAVAEMEKSGSGHIASVTTSLVDQASSSVPSVLTSLTKGGIAAATRSLAIEYAKRGIRVNAVSPGVIKTPMHVPEAHAMLAGFIRSAAWARSRTSSTRSSISRPRSSSPARSCMSTAVKAQGTDPPSIHRNQDVTRMVSTSAAKAFTKRLGIRVPIIQAPMAGTSSAAMAAAVTNAGGLGSIGIGTLDINKAAKMIADVRARTTGPFNVNVFCHRPAVRDPAREMAWIERLRPEFDRLNATPPTQLGQASRASSRTRRCCSCCCVSEWPSSASSTESPGRCCPPLPTRRIALAPRPC